MIITSNEEIHNAFLDKAFLLKNNPMSTYKLIKVALSNGVSNFATNKNSETKKKVVITLVLIERLRNIKKMKAINIVILYPDSTKTCDTPALLNDSRVSFDMPSSDPSNIAALILASSFLTY